MKALLFDLDGTLADTEPFHLQALREVLASHGREVSDQVFHDQMSGRPSLEVAARLFPEQDSAGHSALVEEKEALFRRMAVGLSPTEGLEGLLAQAAELGLRTAIVTNAPRRNAEHTLNVLGLAGRFDTLILAGELPRAKPDPLPYRTALAALGVHADEALAFEDSVPGVRSAVEAGIRTVGISTGPDPGALLRAGASDVILNFHNFPLT